MDEYQLKQMRLEVTSLLQSSALQANTLTLLLAVSRILKNVSRQDIEAAVDALPLHPANAGDLKREAKKLIPIYFP